MDLCGPMSFESINGKRYVLVIVDDYSSYTWVYFLKSKDEALEVIKTFLKKNIVLLQAPVIIVRTDNGAKFKNHVLKEYFDSVGISHQALAVRTPQQNRVVERRNRTLTPQLHESAGGLPSLKLSLHSCSLAGSTNAMGIETSIALVLPAREHECDTSFVLGRPPALS
ncbi:putative ribonuclease H-like domain-containing protein [Tanacetum coccineum]